jgi:hypothetical protein
MSSSHDGAAPHVDRTSGQAEREPNQILGHLDQIARRSADSLGHERRRAAFLRELGRALPWLAVVPLVHIGLQLLRWSTGGEARVLPLVVVALVACGVVLVWAWLTTRERPNAPVARRTALFAADAQLGLEDRLVAADEFLGRRAQTSFEAAAIQDAAARSRAALEAAFTAARTPVALGRRAAAWGAVLVLLLVMSALVARLAPRAPFARVATDDIVAEAGAALAEDERDPRADQAAPEEQPAPPTREDARERARAAETRRVEAAPEVSDAVKESQGKTGAGRSSGAMSTSAASQSQSAPTSKGQESEPSDQALKPPAKSPPKPQAPKDTPPPPEETDEESGATAGKGASKGSNKNPTASDWKSKDQVTDNDDQELEAEEEVDDDEEEQENRGGVQPSLRDRRPPVSRDLTIGFGNGPNPDANGRGGPSEQKKSRGVASLVLGVPVPDRVKGRPGPGPTKVTQERIEPEAEEAQAIPAERVVPRTSPLEAHGAPDMEPALRALVRGYFLARRGTPNG